MLDGPDYLYFIVLHIYSSTFCWRNSFICCLSWHGLANRSLCLSCMLILRPVLFVVQVFQEIDWRTRLSSHQRFRPFPSSKQTNKSFCYLGCIVSASLPLFIPVSMSFSLAYVWESEMVHDSAEPMLVQRVEVTVFAALSYRLYFGHWVMSRLFPQLSLGSTTELWPQSRVTQHLSNTLSFMKMINSLMLIFSLTQTSNFPWLCLNHLLKLRNI